MGEKDDREDESHEEGCDEDRQDGKMGLSSALSCQELTLNASRTFIPSSPPIQHLRVHLQPLLE